MVNCERFVIISTMLLLTTNLVFRWTFEQVLKCIDYVFAEPWCEHFFLWSKLMLGLSDDGINDIQPWNFILGPTLKITIHYSETNWGKVNHPINMIQMTDFTNIWRVTSHFATCNIRWQAKNNHSTRENKIDNLSKETKNNNLMKWKQQFIERNYKR